MTGEPASGDVGVTGVNEAWVTTGCGVGTTALDPTFAPGMTGEVGFTGPPMMVRLAWPPIEVCANAGALAQRLRATIAKATFLISLFLSSVRIVQARHVRCTEGLGTLSGSAEGHRSLG